MLSNKKILCQAIFDAKLVLKCGRFMNIGLQIIKLVSDGICTSHLTPIRSFWSYVSLFDIFPIARIVDTWVSFWFHYVTLENFGIAMWKCISSFLDLLQQHFFSFCLQKMDNVKGKLKIYFWKQKSSVVFQWWGKQINSLNHMLHVLTK